MLDFVTAAEVFGGPSLENDQAAGRAVVRYAALDTPEDIARETAGADGIIITTHPLTAAHIAALGPRVRVIGRAGIGLDAIDLQAAEAAGVAVINFPDYATNEVATHAVAMLLALHRRLIEADRLARLPWGEQSWLSGMAPARDAHARPRRTRPDRARDGRAHAAAGRGDPGLRPGRTAAAGRRGALRRPRRLLESSDLVSLHLPLLPQTEKLFGAAQFERMRPGALLVNVSRGGLIDENALADALAAGQIGGAALDVFASEPLASDARILDAPNTVLSPHVAWFSTTSGPRVRRDTVEAMIVWIESATVPHGNLAARPSRPRDEATAEGVS